MFLIPGNNDGGVLVCRHIKSQRLREPIQLKDLTSGIKVVGYLYRV